jgi:hypothetical protein
MKPKEILKREATPLMRKLGYRGSFPHFQRLLPERVELVTFQVDRYGEPQFVVEITAAPRGDFTTSWGKVIPEKNLQAWDLNNRLRLGSSSSDADHWFSINEGINQTMLRIELLLKEQGDAYFRKTVP